MPNYSIIDTFQKFSSFLKLIDKLAEFKIMLIHHGSFVQKGSLLTFIKCAKVRNIAPKDFIIQAFPWDEDGLVNWEAVNEAWHFHLERHPINIEIVKYKSIW